MTEQVTTPRSRPPAPASVSELARRYPSIDSPFTDQAYPAPDDHEAWRRTVAEGDAQVRQMFESLAPPPDVLARADVEVAGVTTYVLTPTRVTLGPATPVILDIDGGALVMGGGDLAWKMAALPALEREAVTWVPDYRMPPDHPYPAALDDCVAVYRRLLEDRAPSRVVVRGASAGGNLAAALLLRARDEGLPMPAALVLLTPELDLTESGDSFRTNLGIDYMGSLMAANLLYAAGHDLSHPYLSPLFGDVTGFPPTFLQAGTRDLFLSNTVRMHRKLLAAGVPTELHVFEAMPHGGFGGHAPEDQELRTAVRRFEERHLQP